MTTTKTLTLGAVSLGSPFPGASPGAGEEIVGSPPQWSDGSDATYAHLIEGGTSDIDGLAWAVAAPVLAELLSYSVRVRAKSVAGPDPATLAVYFGRTTEERGTFGDLLEIPSDGEIHDATVEGFGFGANPLPDGASVEVIVNSPSSELFVYLVEIIATIPGERATRLWPRDDALGLGAGARIYPPPRSRRLVGGQP